MPCSTESADRPPRATDEPKAAAVNLVISPAEPKAKAAG